MDTTPRYAPATDLFPTPQGFRYLPVESYRFHPPGAHPEGSPIRKDMGVLELTAGGASRWYGCESAHINSELRMVVIGTDPRDEVRMKWEVCTEM